MKTKSVILCALVLLTSSALLFAQKTEVTVRKGKVEAKTQTATVNIEAGQKAVLKKGVNPFVTVDNPLVHDALELYKLVEQEKEHGELRIDSVLIMVARVDWEEVIAAFYFEVPNPMPKATNVLTVYSSPLGDIRVYDLNGNLCKIEEKSLGNFTFAYSVHFSEQVQPGEHFKLIGVTSLDDTAIFPGGEPSVWKEGPLVYVTTSTAVRNALQYRRFILPESAILVDTNHEIVATEAVGGRPAVTLRTYTGPYSDAMCIVALLDPAEDGTTLADLPGKYYGLRSKWDKENSETYHREMTKVLAGIRYEDQSTPLTALLTSYGSIANDDFDLYAQSELFTQTPEGFRDRIEQMRYWVDTLDVLSTPKWPNNPGNGYVHPIYLCRKGSMIREFMLPIVCEDGQWYVHRMFMKPQIGAGKKFEQPTPQEIADAEAKGYLANWEVVGPYIRRGKEYKDKKHDELFDIPFGPELSDVDIPWQPATVEPYEQHPASVNITSALYESVSYLRTEIISDMQKQARLEIYTDDGVKAWLNDKLIHENNVSRGIPDQPDTVNVTLKEGVNHLQLKVTEYVMGSRAIVRLVEP